MAPRTASRNLTLSPNHAVVWCTIGPSAMPSGFAGGSFAVVFAGLSRSPRLRFSPSPASARRSPLTSLRSLRRTLSKLYMSSVNATTAPSKAMRAELIGMCSTFICALSAARTYRVGRHASGQGTPLGERSCKTTLFAGLRPELMIHDPRVLPSSLRSRPGCRRAERPLTSARIPPTVTPSHQVQPSG